MPYLKLISVFLGTNYFENSPKIIWIQIDDPCKNETNQQDHMKIFLSHFLSEESFFNMFKILRVHYAGVLYQPAFSNLSRLHLMRDLLLKIYSLYYQCCVNNIQLTNDRPANYRLPDFNAADSSKSSAVAEGLHTPLITHSSHNVSYPNLSHNITHPPPIPYPQQEPCQTNLSPSPYKQQHHHHQQQQDQQRKSGQPEGSSSDSETNLLKIYSIWRIEFVNKLCMNLYYMIIESFFWKVPRKYKYRIVQ